MPECLIHFVTPPDSLDHSLSFLFNATATTHIYTLSLHDALPISRPVRKMTPSPFPRVLGERGCNGALKLSRRHFCSLAGMNHSDRKSTRLNSSHEWISYAVFCLKKKKYRRHAAPVDPAAAHRGIR